VQGNPNKVQRAGTPTIKTTTLSLRLKRRKNPKIKHRGVIVLSNNIKDNNKKLKYKNKGRKWQT